MKKEKDALDIVDDYNKLTPRQIDSGYQGEPRPSKRKYTKKEKEQLDDIPDIMPSPNLNASERLKQYRESREPIKRQPVIPKEYEDEEIPLEHENKRVHYDKQLVEEEPKAVIKDFTKPRDTRGITTVPQNQVMAPPIDESGDIDLNKLFSSEVGSETDVVKELFSSENIKVKTELSVDEISIISRLELQASMTQNFFLTKVLKELETLRVSKDRKSRGEFVNSFRGIGDQNSGMNAFSKLGNIFKNDKV